MTTLWIFTALFLIVAILIIGRHFYQSNLYAANQANMRGQTNKDLYHEHLAELEKDYREGGVDEENFGYLKEELDRSLLLDMTATVKEQQASDKKTSILWPVFIALFIVIVSAGLYSQQGNYSDVELVMNMPKGEQPAGHPQGEESQAQMVMAQLKALHKEVKDNPNNSDAWFRLGQILTNVGEFDSAVIAFDKVIEVEGPQADVYALQAQAKYYQNNQQRNAEIDELLNKALAVNPDDPTTLMLVGMDHYLNERFNEAASTWQQIIDTNGAGVNAAALQDAIDEAKGMQASEGNGHDGHDHEEQTVIVEPKPQPIDSSKPSITLNVSISDDIIAKLNSGADKTVFIYAIATNGPRMPLAAVKINASDLPLTVTLDDTKAMSPQMTLSSVEQVNVFAVISHAGQPGMKAGDFKGELLQLPVINDKALNLMIDSIVE
ncbi:c-type cytochrome biogenesis protein CcmI [Colwelliaceae bacterium BS250]